VEEVQVPKKKNATIQAKAAAYDRCSALFLKWTELQDNLLIVSKSIEEKQREFDLFDKKKEEKAAENQKAEIAEGDLSKKVYEANANVRKQAFQMGQDRFFIQKMHVDHLLELVETRDKIQEQLNIAQTTMGSYVNFCNNFEKEKRDLNDDLVGLHVQKQMYVENIASVNATLKKEVEINKI
jgi:hypothetical protein